jgi:hypothetical protein
MIYEGGEYQPTIRPGLVLGLLKQMREQVGTLKAKKKEGVKFKVRSLDELVDKVRPVANALGLLIYPVEAKGQGHVVEDGTLAEVQLRVRIQAIEDGSYVDVAGFGLGADGQDKAGGKAGSYAFKAALVQALLAGGAEDTDDTDTPISGGVRAKKGGPKGPTREETVAALDAATDEPSYKAAAALVLKLKPDDQLAVRDLGVIAAAKVRCGLTPA